MSIGFCQSLAIARQLPKNHVALLCNRTQFIGSLFGPPIASFAVQVAIRIETVRSADCTIINLIGELNGEHLSELRIPIEEAQQQVVLGMEEVTLVDLDVIRFLIDCQKQGVQLRGSPAYIVEWIAQEKEHQGRSRRPKRS